MYKSKIKLPYRGQINVIVYVEDGNGNYSYQTGRSLGVPSDDFQSMFDDAVLNAIYKHFSMFKMPVTPSDYKTSITDFIREYEVKDYWFEYFDERGVYDFKVINKNSKRFIRVRRKGKIEMQSRVQYTTKRNISSAESEFMERV